MIHTKGLILFFLFGTVLAHAQVTMAEAMNRSAVRRLPASRPLSMNRNVRMHLPRVNGVQTEAPGRPGKMGSWARCDKQAFGSTLSRPVWFTAVKGALSEIAYPKADRVQTRDSFLVIRNGNQFVDERNLQSVAKRVPGSMAYLIESQGQGISMEKLIQVSPLEDTVIVDYSVKTATGSAKEFIFIHNSNAEMTSGGDAMEVVKDARGEPTLLSYQIDVRGDEPLAILPFATHLVGWSLQQSQGTTGFEGVNSPEDAILAKSWPTAYNVARYGNTAGALSALTQGTVVNFRAVITFTVDRNWQATLEGQLRRGLEASTESLVRAQKNEWAKYLQRLQYDRKDSLSESSILVLKALEDKSNRGAMVAAPGNPALPWNEEAPEHDYEKSRLRIGDSNGGYRRVWPRDLYHKALAFLAVGDLETPVDVLQWFKKVQLTGDRVGMWSQNMWVDGTPSWGTYQQDQTGLPIALLARLVELGIVKYADYREMTTRAMAFLIQRGPYTEQERWEENGGMSPNSLAAAVEGLLAAGWLEEKFGDVQRAMYYRGIAEDWRKNLKTWGLISGGVYGDNYFARMEQGAGPAEWNPTKHSMMRIQNKAPGMPNQFREDSILDLGFTQWILAGLVDPMDGAFTRSLQLVDQLIRKKTPAGIGYIRYNEDSYGENFKGGAWPLLSGERALTALERNEDPTEHVAFLRKSANSGELIPEQDTLSVTPLGWSHGNYLIVRRSLAEGRSFYIPRRDLSVVERRRGGRGFGARAPAARTRP